MSRKQPFSLEEFTAIYSKVPRLCVDLVIRTEQDYLLTLRQKNGFVGLWHLPGSTVHYREPVEKTIQRIAEEELGSEVKVNKFLGYIEYFSEEEQRGFGYSVSLVFECQLLSDKITLDDQVEKYDFFITPPENTVVEQKNFLINTYKH